jgi:hypothetical protein
MGALAGPGAFCAKSGLYLSQAPIACEECTEWRWKSKSRFIKPI